MKKIKLLLIIIILFGCRSKKSTTSTTTEKKTDTVYINNKVIDTFKITETKEVTKPIYIKQEIPCNENQKGSIGSGNNKIDYEVKDNYIYLNAQIDSCYTYYRNLYESKLKDSLEVVRNEKIKTVVETEEVVRYVYPWWFYLMGLALIVMIVLYLKEKTSIFTKIFNFLF